MRALPDYAAFVKDESAMGEAHAERKREGIREISTLSMRR